MAAKIIETNNTPLTKVEVEGVTADIIENAAASPNEPTILPLYNVPWAWDTSSTTFRPCFRAIGRIASMSQGCPQ